MEECAALVIEKELSVRGTEELVRKMLSAKDEKQEENEITVRTVDYKAELEKKLRTRLGRSVHIKDKGRVKKLELEYTDNDDLEALLTAICGKDIFDDEI